MGKDDKEETGFGFKDRAKAEDTLKLLEAHEPNYRRLTVRGLLGRAKRVLTLTKAEDKIKNIKEAMQVFEDWLAELDKNKEKPQKKKEEKKRKRSEDKESSSDVEMEDKGKKERELPAETVPGLGFKDREAAENTLKQLEGRDPDYQQLAVKALIRSANRVLTCTRDETKSSNIKESITILEQFLDDFETRHLSRENNPYISLARVRTCLQLAGDDASDQQDLPVIAVHRTYRASTKRPFEMVLVHLELSPEGKKRSFISSYASVRGQYKRLRTVPSGDGTTWDITRNRVLKELKAKHADAKLFDDRDEPTPEHVAMLLWAYSPQHARANELIAETGVEGEQPPKKKRIE